MRYDSIQRITHEFDGGKILTMRSKWETNYGIYLDFLVKQKEIKGWEYEPERYKFIMTEGNYKVEIGTYLPDFKVTNNDGTFYLVEVKGYRQGTLKLKRMKKYYPEIKIELVDSKEYAVLKKKVGQTGGQSMKQLREINAIKNKENKN